MWIAVDSLIFAIAILSFWSYRKRQALDSVPVVIRVSERIRR